jgi:hypothetical protein
LALLRNSGFVEIFLSSANVNRRHKPISKSISKPMTIGRFEKSFPGQLRELHGHRQTARVVVVKVSPVHKDSAIKLGLFGFDQVNRTTGAGRRANSMGHANSLPMPHQYGPADRHKTNFSAKKQEYRESTSTATTRQKLSSTITLNCFHQLNATVSKANRQRNHHEHNDR